MTAISLLTPVLRMAATMTLMDSEYRVTWEKRVWTPRQDMTASIPVKAAERDSSSNISTVLTYRRMVKGRELSTLQ